MSDHKRAFIKLFDGTANYVHRYQLFSDFIDCATAAIHNRFVHDDDLEKRYFECVKRYKPDDMANMSRLLGEVVMGLESGFCDFLGEVYMELALGNKWRGQVFTPYHLSRLCAQMTYGESLRTLGDIPFVRVLEPSCGSGSMAIAFAEAMMESGHNPQAKMWVHCTDVDSRCAQMAFIQLSLLCIPATIVTGNSLTGEVWKVMNTPAYYMFGWESKLRSPRTQREVAEQPAPVLETGQLALFDLELAS